MFKKDNTKNELIIKLIHIVILLQKNMPIVFLS